MSFGRGRFSRSSCEGAVSSSSMISLQRSIHSSQMKTPGPAISFLTCRWLFPQKLQRSCSFPSLALATRSPSTPNSRRALVLARISAADHLVDYAVFLCVLRVHEVVAVGVASNFLKVLAGVLGEDLLETALEVQGFGRAGLDVRGLAAGARGCPDLVDQNLGVRQCHPLPFRAPREQQRAHRHRNPDANGLD